MGELCKAVSGKPQSGARGIYQADADSDWPCWGRVQHKKDDAVGHMGEGSTRSIAAVPPASP